jgi:hypothetical protein
MGNHHHHHHHKRDGTDIQEERIEGNIMYKLNDRRFIELPKWPLILLDTTGSMNESVSPGSNLARSTLVIDCIGEIARILTPVDNADVQTTLQRGCPLITFNGAEGGIFRGWIHADNIRGEMANVKFHGATHIMDGWRKMLETYENAFTGQPQSNWPLLLVLILTDGEIQDQEEFEHHLRHVHGRAFVEIAVVGYGEDHDRALHHYRHIEKHHKHVRCTAFTREVDPKVIALQLLSMIGTRL